MTNRVIISDSVCKGCGLCVSSCPKKIIHLDRSSMNEKGYNPAAVTDPDRCIACAMCAVICPDSAIRVEKAVKPA